MINISTKTATIHLTLKENKSGFLQYFKGNILILK